MARVYTVLGVGEQTPDTAALVVTAARIVDYTSEPLNLTFDEALEVMVGYARHTVDCEGDRAQTGLTSRLRNSDPNKVAEICAAALLRLADGA